MITNEEANIKLTPEQTQAIEETKSRLLNLETEISIANKNLKVIKIEIEKATKEKTYQDELLSDAETKLAPLKLEVSDLEAQITVKTVEVANLNSDITAKKIDIEDREEKIKEKEQDISYRQIVVEEKEHEIRESIGLLNRKVTDFNSKVAKLREVLPTL